jgi:ABC-2 type transport system permease protein
MNTYVWLFRREVWENRAIWILPVAVGALLLLICMFGTIQLDELPRQLNPEQLRVVAPMLLGGIGTGLFVIMLVYTSWYLMDCLYADRKDRSVLFWKSLPVSDTETVLSKLAMALLVIPLVYFVVADVTALGASFILSVRGGSVVTAALWHPVDWLELQVLALYAILTSALWYLPFSGWLLLVSAWAKKSVTLWAMLAPLVACYVEIKLIGTRLLWTAIISHMGNYGATAFHGDHNFTRTTMIEGDTLRTPGVITEFINPLGFISSAELWVGVLLGAAMVAGAIYLRHRHTES